MKHKIYHVTIRRIFVSEVTIPVAAEKIDLAAGQALKESHDYAFPEPQRQGEDTCVCVKREWKAKAKV